ncbi:MAG: NAD(+) synthase [Gammaproteobacteria bacterium]|nr:NAD(+) synthase [Gammaproteobacteria bacterium]
MVQPLNELVLDFDHDNEINKISLSMRDIVSKKLNRRGVVVAVSGGIDSSVSAALAVKAFGKNKVFALLLPEKDSSNETQSRGEQLVKFLGVDYLKHDIASTLDAIGCYHWRDNAIKEVFPDYEDGWKNKIIISGGLEGQFNHFKLVVQNPSGEILQKNLGIKQYLQIVAATNYKQRIRKTIEYFHADRLNYAVIGTPNRVEYDQGFFVKNGDGSADLKPIAHLYKTQVYSLAKFMGLPDDICNAIPTTDTYSLPQGQDEFYYALPYSQMDVAIWAYNNNRPVSDLADYLGCSVQKAEYVFKDISAKRKTTQYMHLEPQLIEKVDLPIG